MYLMTAAGADFCNFIQDVIVVGKGFMNKLLLSTKSRIVAGKKMSCNIPRKWSFGKKNMPLEKEKHGIRHIICLGRDAEGRKVCLQRRKSLE